MIMNLRILFGRKKLLQFLCIISEKENRGAEGLVGFCSTQIYPHVIVMTYT